MQAARLAIPPARLAIIVVLASGAQFIASGAGSSSDHPSSAVEQADQPAVHRDLADWRRDAAAEHTLSGWQSGFESGLRYDEQSSCWEKPAPWAQRDQWAALGTRPARGEQARPMVY